MRVDLDSAKREFRRIQEEAYCSQRMLDFVLRLWENAELSPDDAGWVLWMICDQYAMRRANDPVAQHKYQREFLELVKHSFPERAHWVVTDATQGTSLLLGGFLVFWSECYRFANDTAPRVSQNRRARFQAHRSNAFSFGYVGEMGHMKSALDVWADLLKEDINWSGQQFATVTHKIHLFEFCALAGETDKAKEMSGDLEGMLNDWLGQVGEPKIVPSEEKPLIGSWESLNGDGLPYKDFGTAVLSAAYRFAKNDQFSAAERLFRMWMDYFGRPLSDDCEAMFLLSCWRNGYSKNEIRRMLGESKVLSADRLILLAPEMADVVG